MKNHFNQVVLQLQHLKSQEVVRKSDIETLEAIIFEWQFGATSSMLASDADFYECEALCERIAEVVEERNLKLYPYEVASSFNSDHLLYRFILSSIDDRYGFYPPQKSSANGEYIWAGSEPDAALRLKIPLARDNGGVILKLGAIMPEMLERIASELRLEVDGKPASFYPAFIRGSLWLIVNLRSLGDSVALALKGVTRNSPLKLDVGPDKRMLSFSLQDVFFFYQP